MRPIPDFPSKTAAANSETSRPSAEIAPMPVIATRRILLASGSVSRAESRTRPGLSRYKPGHALDHLPHSAHFAHLVIRDIDIEFVFEREQDLDRVHGIDIQLLELAL